MKERCLPAEWEHHGCVLLAWPHADTDWNYMLQEVIGCYLDVIRAIARKDHVLLLAPDPEALRPFIADVDPDGRVVIAQYTTNDTWARDFGPFTVRMADGSLRLLDFQFNGWGLKFAADRDNLVTSYLTEKGVFGVDVENRRGFVLEGGSIESDGRGTLLTTSQCLLSPNRNAEMSRSEIDAYLREAFGADRVLWLDYGAMAGDDTDSHIDTLCRLAPGDTIVYTGTSDTSDEHYDELARMKEQLATFRTAEGRPYHLVELPLPAAIYDADCGERLPATYANYLVLDGRILMPGYGQPRTDRLAADTLRIAYPDHEVEIIDCRALIRQHGSLHCITMQLPLTALSDV